jgi:hypothetical protein
MCGECTISHFLDILKELEIFGRNFLNEKVGKSKKELVINNLNYIKHIFCEVFIATLIVPCKEYDFGTFDTADLLRDVLTLYSLDYFTKEEVIHLLTNLEDDDVVEKIYQRI